MTAIQTMPHDDDDMPAEIDFSGSERGKFHQTGTQLHLPVYLERQVHDRLAALAGGKGMEVSTLVNELLKKDIELIDIVSP